MAGLKDALDGNFTRVTIEGQTWVRVSPDDTLENRLSAHPDISITKAHCSAFESGFCFSAGNPFYSGHYETFESAFRAALRDKQKVCTAARS